METIYCFICQKEFGSPSDVSGHECIPVEEEEEPEEEGSDEFCRLCGEVAITSYQQYKEHLYSHLLSKLNNDFRSDYDKDKKACERCEEPVEDCVSYIKHLALDHDEILKYIDDDTMSHLKNVLHKTNHMNSSSIGDPMEHASFEMDFSFKDEDELSPGYDVEQEEHEGIICDYSSRESGDPNSFSRSTPNEEPFMEETEGEIEVAEEEMEDLSPEAKGKAPPPTLNNGETHHPPNIPSPERKHMGELTNNYEPSPNILASGNPHET
eukprot:TRINITY_DN166_c0_g1_i1.p1 TRINITY_DN166_c0_g1~~TRINITY_DN166_c0_g1_i1.p1  ORF type:complete len:303 (-),score=84.40 TRINITY_DN166_c0_g1_i1:1490-2290(-)